MYIVNSYFAPICYIVVYGSGTCTPRFYFLVQLCSSRMSDLPPPDLGSEEISVSPTSSSSSFVPIDKNQLQDAVQVVSEAKEFNSLILDYVRKATPASEVNNNYHIVSVFGSQSTGKSTLLNRLFNTNFDVMDESNRLQTTKGIWMAYSSIITTSQGPVPSKGGENIFVMDVEGTDGRERGEDQDFERKAALFALSTSEVLIINVWEHQIGLYQGANMGLLKTVFEVNLSLFGRTKLEMNEHKVLLLFVIRDHIGTTSKESLAATVTQDLIKMWDSLNKPQELAHLQFSDFFDIQFHTLRHKILQPGEFTTDVQLLGDRFTDHKNEDFLFKKYYHHDIPIDGWTMYAENCWDQIDKNKDLDLPTQQILVAKFKCDEILTSVFEEFRSKFEERHAKYAPTDIKEEVDYEELGGSLGDLKEDTLENYDMMASRYNQSVYLQKRKTLEQKITDVYQDLVDQHGAHMVLKLSAKFASSLSSKKLPKDVSFALATEALRKDIVHQFLKNCSCITLNGSLDHAKHVTSFTRKLDSILLKQRFVELNSILAKSLKKVESAVAKAITQEISEPSESTWDRVLEKFKGAQDEYFYSKYETATGVDFGLGTSASVNERALEKFQFRAWSLLHLQMRKLISKDNLVIILKDRFEDKFRYDENGIPRLYQNSHELELNFTAAKEHALKALPILTLATLSDGTTIVPKYDVRDKRLQKKLGAAFDTTGEVDLKDEDVELDTDEEDEDENEPKCFAEAISETDKALVLSKFKKETDATSVESKRALIQHVTHIPYYIYIVILVLGWNEFMAVLRNPFFFTLLLMLGAGTYVLYHLNLLKPAMVVVQRMFDECLVIAKQKLKEFIDEQPQEHAKRLSKMAGITEDKPEEIEMLDLTPPGEGS